MAIHKKILIGVDEAGYGPNLGPLVIGVTVWRVPKSFTETQVTELFAQFARPERWSAGCAHVPLGDSKRLYQPTWGLASLETGLLSMIEQSNPKCQHLHEFMEVFATFDDGEQIEAAPWYKTLNDWRVPQDADCREVLRLSKLASGRLIRAEVDFVTARGLVISEYAFNGALQRLGSKGHVLSHHTLALVAKLLAEHCEDAEIYCDRQGGRKNYLPLLIGALPEEWFDSLPSSSQRSSYRNRGERSLEFHFSVRGDRFPPTALASMLAKCLREYLMRPLNKFWEAHIPGLKPTAGYPVDAVRFRSEIEPVAKRLGLKPDGWWRSR